MKNILGYLGWVLLMVLVMYLMLWESKPVAAQSAKVIELQSEDARDLKIFSSMLDQATRDFEKEKKKILEKYLLVPDGDPQASGLLYSEFTDGGVIKFAPCSSHETELSCLAMDSSKDEKKIDQKMKRYRIGWTDGFEWTSDYKFIVPPRPKSPMASCGVISGDRMTFIGPRLLQ